MILAKALLGNVLHLAVIVLEKTDHRRCRQSWQVRGKEQSQCFPVRLAQ